MSEIGYRSAAARCELCDVEVEVGSLDELVGLSSCARCRAGDLERAMRRWGLELDTHLTQAHRQRQASFNVEVKRPTFLEAFARLDRDSGPKRGWFSRVFGKRDPEVGVQAFDDAVLIQPDDGAREATMALLELPGVRKAVKALVEMGCEVHLTGKAVWVYDSDAGAMHRLSDLSEAEPLAIVLAAQVERYARGL